MVKFPKKIVRRGDSDTITIPKEQMLAGNFSLGELVNVEITKFEAEDDGTNKS